MVALLLAPSSVCKLLTQFPTIVRDSFSAWKHTLHSIEHVIETTGCPITAAAHWLELEQRQRRSSENWRRQASSTGPSHPGHPPYTWY
jgi:hypothetical protein